MLEVDGNVTHALFVSSAEPRQLGLLPKPMSSLLVFFLGCLLIW